VTDDAALPAEGGAGAGLEPVRVVKGVLAPRERVFEAFADLRSWWPWPGDDLIGYEVEESDPPSRLALAWHPGRPVHEASRVELTFEATSPVSTRVRLMHNGWAALGEQAAELRAEWARPQGWAFALRRFAEHVDDPELHRTFGRMLTNDVFLLLDALPADGPDGSPAYDETAEAALRAAFAAAHHWYAGGEPINLQRAEWLLAHVHTLAGHVDEAARYARRCRALTDEQELTDFDRAYALLAQARAAALGDDAQAARRLRDEALAVPIDDPDDAAKVREDAERGPWFGAV
jgi:uncharacterized protein YndB with AHSA1/START domain